MRSFRPGPLIQESVRHLPLTMLGNAIAGLAIALFLHPFLPIRLLSLVLFSVFVALLISTTVHTACHAAKYLLDPSTVAGALAGSLAIAITVTTLDALLIQSISSLLPDELRDGSQFRFLYAPSLFLSLSMTTMSVLYEVHVDRLAMAHPGLESPQAESGFLFLRKNGGHERVEVEAVHYLTARGDRTVLHLADREIIVPFSLGDIMKRLPTSFLRIHKSHAVRLDVIRRIEYYIGGRYIVTLNDDDETTLVSGRAYGPQLKARTGIGR